MKTKFVVMLWVLLSVTTSSLKEARANDKKLSLEQIFSSSELAVQGNLVPVWSPDGEYLVYMKPNPSNPDLRDIWKYELAKKEKSLWIRAQELVWADGSPYRIKYFEILSDGQRVVFTDVVPARSLKTGRTLHVFDLRTRKFDCLLSSAQAEIIQLSPDGQKVGFVRDHNIFSVNVNTQVETQLTFDGSPEVLNGTFDWVYEEEFHLINAWQWSPDSSAIAYWQLDQSRVPTFPLVQYGPVHAKVEMMRYPKPGDPNSSARIGVVELPAEDARAEGVKSVTQWISLSDDSGDFYLPRMQWLPSGHRLAIQKLNRRQNHLELFLADAKTGKGWRILSEEHEKWIDVQDDLKFFDGGRKFLWTSDRDGFKHIYVYGVGVDGQSESKSPSVSLLAQLTSGHWEVASILGLDESTDKVYFTGNKTSIYEKHFFSVPLEAKEGKYKVSQISKTVGSHSIRVSPRFLYYLDNYSNFHNPTTTRIHRIDGERIESPEPLVMPPLGEYALARGKTFSFKTAVDVSLNGIMLRPLDFDPKKQYPVLMHVYGGPGYQIAINQWSRWNLWYQYMAQQGYIIVLVDNRGTGGRGCEFKKVTYRNLGDLESQDVLATVEFLKHMPWVNSSRIGIIGWSYGGYLSAMSMCKSGGSIAAGVCVAPVTDWRLYDSIYTERFMGTPEDNPVGYRQSSVLESVEGLTGDVLLVHGTGDGNVHFQNSMNFVKACVEKGKLIEAMYYPDQDHSINAGPKTQLHLYTKITEFIRRKL